MAPLPIEIHVDIAKASTLPADVYHAREYFDVQRERVFARTWQALPDVARARAERLPGHLG